MELTQLLTAENESKLGICMCLRLRVECVWLNGSLDTIKYQDCTLSSCYNCVEVKFNIIECVFSVSNANKTNEFRGTNAINNHILCCIKVYHSTLTGSILPLQQDNNNK